MLLGAHAMTDCAPSSQFGTRFWLLQCIPRVQLLLKGQANQKSRLSVSLLPGGQLLSERIAFSTQASPFVEAALRGACIWVLLVAVRLYRQPTRLFFVVCTVHHSVLLSARLASLDTPTELTL